MTQATDIAKEVQHWIDTRQDAIKDFIKELALMESPSSDREALSAAAYMAGRPNEGAWNVYRKGSR